MSYDNEVLLRHINVKIVWAGVHRINLDHDRAQSENSNEPWFDLQLDAPNSRPFTYNTLIKFLYMFRALTLLIIRRSTS
jgi:hypothetical protein